MTDFHALCVELTDCLEKADWPHRHKDVFQQWTNIAHAALAESDGPTVSDDREPASVAMQPSDDAIAPPLSPAAQAVLDAFNSVTYYPDENDERMLAAVLRAAADQAHPKAHIEDIDYVHQSYVDGWKDALDIIFAIADELEGL